MRSDCPSSARSAANPTLPFLKWPGGKRWLATTIADLLNANLKGRYYEPFLGGGSVFFCLRPRRATLSDINGDLISTYQMVRDCPREILATLRRIEISESSYYKIRSSQPQDLVLRAARFLYLNRTAFGGIYRLNLKGEFNVPYGGGHRDPSILWNTDFLAAACSALRGALLKHCDFETILNKAAAGDVAYCDPTYSVAHNCNGFIRYNERNFSWSDQQRLAEAAMRAAARGAFVVVSNAHHTSIRSLYPQAEFRTVERQSSVARDPLKRQRVKEYLILLGSDQGGECRIFAQSDI
jgi:DNA adenine methylase